MLKEIDDFFWLKEKTKTPLMWKIREKAQKLEELLVKERLEDELYAEKTDRDISREYEDNLLSVI